MSGNAFYRLHAAAAVAVYLAGNSAIAVHATPLQSARFIGTVGCKSSSCHGGAGEKRSQYLTWVQQDFHARAYALLIDARSARIAKALSLPAAQRAVVARFVIPLPVRRARTAMATAHAGRGRFLRKLSSAASPWFRGHTRKDWKYAIRVAAGMRDLRISMFAPIRAWRAIKMWIQTSSVGHPVLTFELDGQSVAQPRHWRDDDPWSGHGPGWSGRRWPCAR